MATASSNTYRVPPRTSSLNPPLSPGITPARQAQLSSSSYSHHTEDPLIFEIGSRLLRAGFAGESAPRCVLEWSNEVFWCREGIVWTGGASNRDEDGRGELWRGDLRSVELGVVEDVVERGVRMAYNKYLLLDSKLKRVMIVTPPLLSTPVLTALLKSLFVHFQMPGIMLLSAPTMATLSAGTRSALVLDLGWEESTATAIYELRPVGQPRRTRRAGRLLRDFWRDLLTTSTTSTPKTPKLPNTTIDDIISRLAWCRKHNHPPIPTADDTTPIALPLPLPLPLPTGTTHLPFSALADPTEKCFFAPTTVPSSSPDHPDDDDLPLPRLVYEALRAAPVDVRAACMQRIVIVGGASQVLGLKRRVVDEVRLLVEREGWCRVGGRQSGVPPPVPPKAEEEEQVQEREKEVSYEWRVEDRGGALSPGSPRGGLEKGLQQQPAGTPRVRGLESMGAWVGASLVAGMKGRGTVELEREKFLQAVAGGGTGLPVGY
ncbi:uncharacterized protein H6S33_004359 [Morchella sextelata]|uniref:uncharacterized protein n=1 Tax=Morchella sextelata TaxID=1174677 RepID=UPI001D047F82|nr:uncharacterized protein H6S33_004359 [Morchella sextelata]KAH0605902.1 hypothetical protein H6S33_004359 [Morchella sextelata]